MPFLRTTLLVIFIYLPPGPHARASEPPKLPDSALIEEFDVYNDGDWLLVPVTIRGKTYSFVLDTGCTSTFLDISLISGNLIDEVPTLGADGNVAKNMKLYQAPPMRIGKTSTGKPWHLSSATTWPKSSRSFGARDIWRESAWTFFAISRCGSTLSRGKLCLLRLSRSASKRALHSDAFPGCREKDGMGRGRSSRMGSGVISHRYGSAQD